MLLHLTSHLSALVTLLYSAPDTSTTAVITITFTWVHSVTAGVELHYLRHVAVVGSSCQCDCSTGAVPSLQCHEEYRVAGRVSMTMMSRALRLRAGRRATCAGRPKPYLHICNDV